MNQRALLVALAAVAVIWVDSQTVDQDTENWIRTLFSQPNTLKMRREIRDTTSENLQNFFRAINILKNDRTLRPNKYDALCSLHTILMNIAHQGPNFLGWHRIYLILFENALNQVVPGVYVPFWNNTLDSSMSDPSRSSMFTADFVGNGRGLVNTGPFRGWNTPHGLLRRNIDRGGSLMTSRDERNVMSRFHLEDITFPNAPNWTNVEEMHNQVHVWIGGQMRRIESACYDPMFWMHHAYIDCLWENFREKQKANGIDPSSDYPEFSFGQRLHAPNSRLGFGWLLIRHAIHEYFSESFYRCAATPTCSRQRPSCGSEWLQCDFRQNRCMSRPADSSSTNQQRQVPSFRSNSGSTSTGRGRFSSNSRRRTSNRWWNA